MADDQEFLADCTRFINEKWKNKDCVRCGNQTWSAMPDSAVIVVCVQSMWRDNRPTTYYEMMGVYCDNCGAVEHILKPVFDEWRKKK